MFGIAAFFVVQSQQPEFVLPIQPAQILAIDADLDGKGVVFGIDTGSFDFLLKPNTVANANGQTTQVQLGFLSPSPVDAKIATFPSPAQGIIGLNLIHQKAMGIDAADGALSFWNAGNLTPDQVNFWFSHFADFSAKGGWTPVTQIPYNVVDLEEAGDGHFLVDGNINGAPAKFGLDTDTSVSSIDGSAVTATGFLDLESSSFGGLQHSWPVHVGIVDSVAFGPDEMKAVPIIETPSGSLSPAQGLLAYDFFANRRAIIDFPAHKLYFSDPPATPAGREALLPYGIHLAPFIAGHQFIGVIPDSIAAKAGLHSGDDLVQVDGQAVDPSNAPKTGSSMPFDYTKSGLPKSLKLMTRAASGQTSSYALSLP